MRVAFVNENTLGHASYLLPYVKALEARPELGIVPSLIHATPLPPALERRVNFPLRGLRKWGLDFYAARWRLTVSRYVLEQLQALRARQPLDAIVVNTQSVALALVEMAAHVPVLVCLDATFEQLARSRWFAPNAPSRWFLPLTLAPLRGRERRLFRAARRLLPWSDLVRESLVRDYGLPTERISLLPPAVELSPPGPPPATPRSRPRILFVGGDFRRKGGPLLLECFRRHFARRCDLHIVTQSALATEPGVFVHRDILAHSPAWRECWEQADVFVFPSTLETFGIVLVEALAFGVPVVSAEVGAARFILADGEAGWLLPELDETSLAGAINEVLSQPVLARARVEAGRRRVRAVFNPDTNTARLAHWLKAAAP